jgi:rubrerythrin
MSRENFLKAIDFAIGGEREAVAFYRGLLTQTNDASAQAMLEELALVEEGHITALEAVRAGGEDRLAAKTVRDLGISEYLVDIEPKPDMSFQDILIIAMKREEKARDLYRDLAQSYPDAELERVFLRLSADEAEHKLRLEKTYDSLVLNEN